MPAKPSLTEAQRQVIALVCRGLSAKEIACALSISEPAAKSRLRAAGRRLGEVKVAAIAYQAGRLRLV